jgi:hypothetical protein
MMAGGRARDDGRHEGEGTGEGRMAGGRGKADGNRTGEGASKGSWEANEGGRTGERRDGDEWIRLRRKENGKRKRKRK